MDRSSQSQHNPPDLRVYGEESTPRSTGSKNTWVVKKKSPAVEQEDDTRYPGVDETTDTLPCYGAIGGGEPAKVEIKLDISRLESLQQEQQQRQGQLNLLHLKQPASQPQSSVSEVNGDKGNIAAKPKPFKAPLVPEPPMYSKFPQWGPWCNINHPDDKVIFRQTNLMPGDYFLKNRDYEVEKKLGEGGNGKVYQVHLVSDKSKKMVLKRTTYRKEEVKVYKLLGDHNHIVKHLGVTFSEKEGRVCIFMELCDDSLFNYMRSRLKRRLSVDEAMDFWLQIRDAVEYLHELAIIHKDLKAENVLTKGGRALLADFDSAMRLLNKVTEVTEEGLEPRGTEGFISPEVLARASHGRPADIFSMGCWLIEMTIGCPGNNSLRGKIEKLRERDSELAELVEACVSERPEDRPTARSLLDWSVVKRYLAAGKNVCHWSQCQETSATEDQTATLHALEYRAGESDLQEEL